MKPFSIAFLFLQMSVSISSGQMQVSAGSLIHYENFPSSYITDRNVDVWLPPAYHNDNKYDVLYMQDGQMLFDSTTTWNHQAWDIDETIDRLLNEKKIRPCIVVAISNIGLERHSDYFPQKVFESLSAEQQAYVFNAGRPEGAPVFNFPVNSDNYLKFIVEELKPFIDSAYSTLPSRKNTFIGGSSMGAMISLYAICEYPEIFGGAICMSTHWPGIFTLENNPVPDAMIAYLQNHLPDPSSHKLYFDYGTATLDQLYPGIQISVNAVMREKKYKKKNWETLQFTGAEHTEAAWKERFGIPLQFMLSPH